MGSREQEKLGAGEEVAASRDSRGCDQMGGCRNGEGTASGSCLEEESIGLAGVVEEVTELLRVWS